MNAGEIAQLGWQWAGEDSRYDDGSLPSGITSDLLLRLNQAYSTVASHKFPRVGIVPFRGMEQYGTFTSKYVVTTVSAVTDAGEFTLASSDVQVGDVVTVSNETVEVLTSDGAGGVTVVPDLSGAPSSGDSAVVRTKQYDIVDDVGATARRVIEVQDIYDLSNKQEVYRVNNVQFFDDDGRSPGVPDVYVRYGTTTLLLNQPPDEEYVYRVRYIQLPDELTSASDELVMPVSFHEAIAMRLAFILLLVREDYNAAWKMKQNYQEELQRLQNEYEPYWDTDVGRVIWQ